jgi:hypothetical protein
MTPRPGDRRWVEYHGTEWKDLVEQGWVTAEVYEAGVLATARMALMLYHPDDGRRT